MTDDAQQPAPGVFPWNNIAQSNALSQDVTVSQYLVKREKELIQQTAALRGLLAPKEKELEAVRQAMEAIGLPRSYAEGLRPFLEQDEGAQKAYPGIFNATDAAMLNLLAENLTIKDMILRALNDHFKKGATPSELSDYMRTAYGRIVDRNSISPQLARLRDEGLVQNTNALSGHWELTLRGNLTETVNEVDRAHARRQRWYGKDQKKED
jgi:hypothetical protein